MFPRPPAAAVKAAAPAAAAASAFRVFAKLHLFLNASTTRRHGAAHAAAHGGLLPRPQRPCALAVRPAIPAADRKGDQSVSVHCEYLETQRERSPQS